MIPDIKNNVLLGCIIEESDNNTIVIPEGVSAIAKKVFKKSDDLHNITLPSTLVLIGCEAFSECSQLESIVIPDSVKVIEKAAFYGCWSLKSVILPKGLTEILDFTFANTGIKSIDLPDSVEVIDTAAFTNSCLTGIEIPKSVKEIRRNAFYKCMDLKSVKFAGGPQIIGENSFSDCMSLKSIDIPEGTTEISASAFYSCNLMQITLPKTLRKIGVFSFGYNHLTDIEIPDGVEEIDHLAFYRTHLKKIVLPDSVNKIAGHFADAKVEVVLGENNPAFIQRDKYILSRDGKTLYRSANRKEAIIPEGVETIGASAFGECNDLERIVMPPSVITIDGAAFCSCKNLKEVILSPNIRTIERHAFLYCNNLSNITLPDSLEALSDSFSGCVFDNLVVPTKTVITDSFFFWHGIDDIKKLTINLAVTDLPSDQLFSSDRRKAEEKIIKGFVYGMNSGYPFSAEVIEKNHQWLKSMGAASLIDYPEDFIFYTLKNEVISCECAEQLLDIYPNISLSLRSAIADYTSAGSDPLDKFRLI